MTCCISATPAPAGWWRWTPDGVIRRTLLKPQTDLLTDDAEFKPSKLAVNDTGTVYVAASGI